MKRYGYRGAGGDTMEEEYRIGTGESDCRTAV